MDAAHHGCRAASVTTLLVAGVTLVVFLLGRIRRVRRRYDAWGVRRGFGTARQGGRSPDPGPLPEEPVRR